MRGGGGKWRRSRSESVHMLISFDVFKHVRLTAELIAERSGGQYAVRQRE